MLSRFLSFLFNMMSEARDTCKTRWIRKILSWDYLRPNKCMVACCPEVMSQFHWLLLPSALARGSESRHKVRMYMHMYAYMYVCMWWVTLRNVTRNVVTYYRYRPYVHHIIWYARLRCSWSWMTALFCDGDGGQEWWLRGAMELLLQQT